MERLQELLDRLARLAELSDEDLATLEQDMMGLFDELAGDDLTAEHVEAMGQLRDGLVEVRECAATRIAAADDLRAQADALAADVHGDGGDGAAGDDGGTGDDGAGDGAGDGDAGAGDAGDGTGDGAGDGAGDDAGTQAAADAGGDTPPEPGSPEAIAAAAAARRAAARPTIGHIAARRPASRAPRPRPAADRGRAVILAAAGNQGYVAGQEMNRDQLAEAFVRRADALRRRPFHGASEPITIATVRGEYPEERRLSKDDAQLNERLFRQEQEARVASGGLCAPLTPLYDVVGISDDSRPLRSGLPGYQFDRGGARWVPPPRLGDFAAGVDVWTVANDTALNDPATKPCVRVECDDEQTVTADAITKCLEVGNFFARTYDERVQAILDLLGAEHSRLAERTHLAKMASESTAVTLGQHLGAARDLLAGLDLLLAGYENRWRARDGINMTWVLPEWVHDLVRADLARELPGATAERLATADAMIDDWIALRGVQPVWLLEGEAGQDWPAPQGVGAVEGWPSTVITYLFHSGAWNFGDGGALDLGIVRDSTLNSTNDLQIWSETFEAVFFRGIESIRATFDVCPSGWTSATVDIDPCSIGS